jgi:hypothetical protein
MHFQSISRGQVRAAGMIDRQAALPHHFEVTIIEGMTQIPAYAEDDDFALVMTPFEWIRFSTADSRY